MNGEKIIDFKAKWIKWTLDFVQTDLNSVTKSKLRGLCCEMRYFIKPGFGSEFPFENYLAMNPFDELPQTQITNFDGAMLSQLRKQQTRIPEPKRLEESISEMLIELPHIQDSLRGFLGKTQNVLENFEHYSEGSQVVVPIPGPDIKDMAFSIPLPKTEGVLQIASYTPSPHWDIVVSSAGNLDRAQWAILNFAKLMRDTPSRTITKCKGCARYFVNLSFREKLYCNPACASRSIAQMKRDELKKDSRKYKAYLRKQRQYSKKRYLKMRQAQFGPNVRIGRKGRKRKLRREI